MSDETPGEKASKSVADRMSSRLGDTEENEQNAMNASNAKSGKSEVDNMDATQATRETSEPSAWDAGSVRDAWNGMTFYVPDEMREVFDDEYRRMEFELGGEVGEETLKKDRHYKPLVLTHGLERLQEMDADEIEAALLEMMDDG